MFPHVESVWERKDDDTSHCTMILQPLEKFLRNTKIQLLFGGEFVLIEFSCTDDDSFLVPQNLMSFYQQGLLEQRRQKSSGKSTTSKNDRFRDCTFLEETNDRLKAALDKSVNELRASAKPLKQQQQQQQQQPSQTLKTSNSSENAKSDESSNSQQAQHPVWHMLVRMPFAVKKAEPNKYIPCQSWISEYKDTYTSKITNILGFEFTMA